MPTSNVIVGGRYRHDNTFRIMLLESASVPELDNSVFLIDPDAYCKRNTFIDKAWRGSWDEFLNQWTEYPDDPNRVN